MNCRPGDLARVVAPGYFIRCWCGAQTLVVKPDTLVVCAQPYADGWYLAEPLKVDAIRACGEHERLTGTCGSLPDHLLRPIRDPGADAVDEMVAKVGVAPKTLTEVREVSHG